MEKYEACPMWEKIFSEKLFEKDSLDDLMSKKNYKIALYNPSTHGTFFLNNIMYKVAEALGNDIFLLERIRNRNIFGGHTITYRNIVLDLDYLQALEECLFIKDAMDSNCSLLEIGAGYGRTCHSIISLFPSINSYSIVDFPQMLNISKAYLSRVLTTKEFDKIQFLDFSQFRDLEKKKIYFDLVMNIDSMQEMPEQTVRDYLNFIDCHAQYFYTKNTLGKFSPEMTGAMSSAQVNPALSSGILRDTINIFCPDELAMAQQNFLIEFSPSKLFSAFKSGKTLAWSHYYQVLYKKS